MASKLEVEVGKLRLFPNADPDQIGEHYAKLHEMETGPAYDALGEEVETTYTVKETPDGYDVTIIERHR